MVRLLSSHRHFADVTRWVGRGLLHRSRPGQQQCAGQSPIPANLRRLSTTVSALQPPLLVDSSNIEKIVSGYDNLLLDCDGVLWGTDHFTPFTRISEVVDKFRLLKKKLRFVTNNSLHARGAYLHKFQTLAGFNAEEEDVFGVAYIAAMYIKDILKTQGTCYVIGSKGMVEELDKSDIPHFGFGPDTDVPSVNPADLEHILDLGHNNVDVVLVGFDVHFSYNKLFRAASYLSNPDCHYMATNDMEKWIQLSKNCRQPLVGSYLPAISIAAGRQPLVLGKPHKYIMDCILTQEPSLDLKRTLMVGDSLKTDIGFARNIGIDSLLVLSGATTRETFNKIQQKQELEGGILPTYFMESFSDFANLL